MKNIDNINKHLSSLGRDTFVFQTFDDSPQKRGGLTKTFYGTIEEHYDDLMSLNEKGAGVFVTVNRTDGPSRKADNIVARTAHFADSDNGPIDIVVAKNNFYVYALNAKSSTIGEYQRTLFGGLKFIETVSGLPAPATGLATY